MSQAACDGNLPQDWCPSIVVESLTVLQPILQTNDILAEDSLLLSYLNLLFQLLELHPEAFFGRANPVSIQNTCQVVSIIFETLSSSSSSIYRYSVFSVPLRFVLQSSSMSSSCKWSPRCVCEISDRWERFDKYIMIWLWNNSIIILIVMVLRSDHPPPVQYILWGWISINQMPINVANYWPIFILWLPSSGQLMQLNLISSSTSPPPGSGDLFSESNGTDSLSIFERQIAHVSQTTWHDDELHSNTQSHLLIECW